MNASVFLSPALDATKLSVRVVNKNSEKKVLLYDIHYSRIKFNYYRAEKRHFPPRALSRSGSEGMFSAADRQSVPAVEHP